MPYVFKDDGYPEAREFDDNYVLVPATRSRVERRPVINRPASLLSLLARLKGRPARIAARAAPRPGSLASAP